MDINLSHQFDQLHDQDGNNFPSSNKNSHNSSSQIDGTQQRDRVMGVETHDGGRKVPMITQYAYNRIDTGKKGRLTCQ
jgi:hypothetical protein